jgi:hypothetical protein
LRIEAVEDLVTVFEDGVNVVHLSRSCPEHLATSARRLTRSGPRTWAGVFRGAASEKHRLNDWTDDAKLSEDVLFWREALADLVGARTVGVRLAVLESAMCPRMHVDRVPLRLVITYAGHGTEYLNEPLDAAVGGSPIESRLTSPFAFVESAAPADVLLLKGEAWHGNRGRGAVHRSPDASRFERRLVLTLDPL